MANTPQSKKPKRKFPEDREFQSKTIKGNQFSSERYTSEAKTVLVIKGSLSSEAYDDILHAVDQTLNYHGL